MSMPVESSTDLEELSGFRNKLQQPSSHEGCSGIDCVFSELEGTNVVIDDEPVGLTEFSGFWIRGLESGPTTMNNLPPELMVKIFSYLDIATSSRCRRVCSAWDDLTHSTSLRKVAIVQPAVIKELLRRPGAMDKFMIWLEELQLDEVEHAVLSCKNWDSGGEKWVLGADLYLKHAFNASKCPNLRYITLDGVRLNFDQLYHLSNTCRYIHLNDVIIKPHLYGPPSVEFALPYSGSVSACIRLCTVRCPDTGRMAVRMDEFWDAIDASLRPLDEKEISSILRRLHNPLSWTRSGLRAICRSLEPAFQDGTLTLDTLDRDTFKNMKRYTQRLFLR